MSKPPFSRSILLSLSPQTKASPEDGPPSNAATISPTTAIPHIVPAAIRCGNTLARTKDDPGAYFAAQLLTQRLDELKSYLWLAGVPSCARALHRQRLMGREILITEDVDEHLVWHEARIFIKPLPTFLLDLQCWERNLCKTQQLYEASCSFLLSYAWLVKHESDLRIAHEKGLLPDAVDWASWTDFIGDFLEHIDLQSLSGISPRFQYGELRLSRLNKIYRLTRFNWRDIVRGYMTSSTWYKDFFARNFAWLLAVFAVLSVALSAMQVVVTLPQGGQAFENASYGFSVASLFIAAGAVLIGLFVWTILFTYHVLRAHNNDRKVINERRNLAAVKGEARC
jgi:hypothetical protein